VPIPNFPDPAIDTPLATAPSRQMAVLAGGCFWCVEAVFKQLAGVESVRSGYAGGTAETANYKTVCSGTTDHAEVIEVIYDASKTTFGQLLKIHFSIAHDPTQLNQQGNDVGMQYRSAIFYADDEQRRIGEAYIRQLNDAHVFNSPIVTALEPLQRFFVAESYHQNYAELNPGQPYIAYVAQPKVEKLRAYFGDRLKK
jgi:peptide-methionine (S)-S-oxide reductase